MTPMLATHLPMLGLALLVSAILFFTLRTEPVAGQGGRISNMAQLDGRDVPPRSEPLPQPRDPETAVREEFEIARARGTAEAWQLFISRHGQHDLAVEARNEIDLLEERP